jgi:hypothetical protein
MPVRRRMNFAEVLAPETAAYHLMQIAPEELPRPYAGHFPAAARAIAGPMRTGKCESLKAIRVIPA